MNHYNRQYYWKRFLQYEETMGLTIFDAGKWMRFFKEMNWPDMVEDVENYYFASQPIVIL